MTVNFRNETFCELSKIQTKAPVSFWTTCSYPFLYKNEKRKKREEENKKETQMGWILIILRGKRSSKVHLKHEFGKKNLGERKGFLFSKQLYCPVSMYL